MAILQNDGKRSKRRPSLKGGVMLDVVNGSERARAWPKSRSRNKHPHTQEQNEWFRAAQWATKYMAPEMLFDAINATKGTPLLPRDILTMMLSGRLLSFTMPDGRTIWSKAVMSDVSTSLDVITNVPGAMLIRGEKEWTALLPGDEGEVLQARAPGELPSWGPLSGIGGSNWWFAPPSAAAFTYAGYDSNAPDVIQHPGAGMCVSWKAPIANDRSRILHRPISDGSKDFTLFASVLAFVPAINFSGMEVGIYRANSNRCAGIQYWMDGRPVVRSRIGFANLGTNWSTPEYMFPPISRVFIRIVKAGANLHFDISGDGAMWRRIHSGSVASMLDGPPTGVFVGCCYNRTSGPPVTQAVECLTVTGPGA